MALAGDKKTVSLGGGTTSNWVLRDTNQLYVGIEDGTKFNIKSPGLNQEERSVSFEVSEDPSLGYLQVKNGTLISAIVANNPQAQNAASFVMKKNVSQSKPKCVAFAQNEMLICGSQDEPVVMNTTNAMKDSSTWFLVQDASE